MTDWLIIIGMMLVTFPVRLSAVALLDAERLPATITRGLRFVPPAALAAIVFPGLIMPKGAVDLSVGNLHLLAGAIAGVVAWRSRQTLLPIGVGMALLWMLQWLVGG
jgi:branched-subunit amino acid transport protein